MPDLPTIAVTQAQAERIMAAFTGLADSTGTPLTPTQAYRRWLRAQVTDHVIAQEATALDAQHVQARSTALAKLRADLA